MLGNACGFEVVASASCISDTCGSEAAWRF